MPRVVDRTARRAELAAAAARVFAERGVANTSVSDIVKAAGVAQGTFYLYFASKDDVVLAVVDEMAGRMIEGITAAVDASGSTAVEKFLGLRDVLMAFDVEPTAVELADFMHRPENRPLHDRMAEHFVPALIPLMESIVSQGVAEGVFNVRDPHAAAWFVLGGLQSAELSGTPVADMPAAILAVTGFALRALGYSAVSA
jgi:TetR/AcrR family transcriptional regulator, fatty acid metabolism regulator protein